MVFIMAKVTVYGAPWCPWCMKAKEFLEEKKVEFEWKDVQYDENAKELMDKSGQSGIPVIVIDEKMIVGFQVEKVKELLGIEE